MVNNTVDAFKQPVVRDRVHRENEIGIDARRRRRGTSGSSSGPPRPALDKDGLDSRAANGLDDCVCHVLGVVDDNRAEANVHDLFRLVCQERLQLGCRLPAGVGIVEEEETADVNMVGPIDGRWNESWTEAVDNRRHCIVLVRDSRLKIKFVFYFY